MFYKHSFIQQILTFCIQCRTSFTCRTSAYVCMHSYVFIKVERPRQPLCAQLSNLTKTISILITALIKADKTVARLSLHEADCCTKDLDDYT
jgi:hypothetical protein